MCEASSLLLMLEMKAYKLEEFLGDLFQMSVDGEAEAGLSFFAVGIMIGWAGASSVVERRLQWM